MNKQSLIRNSNSEMYGCRRVTGDASQHMLTRCHNIRLGPNWAELRRREPSLEEKLWFIEEGRGGHAKQRELEEKAGFKYRQIYRWKQRHE